MHESFLEKDKSSWSHGRSYIRVRQTVIIWDYIPLVHGQTIGAATGLYSLIVGFLVSLACIIVVSLVTKGPDQSIIDEI